VRLTDTCAAANFGSRGAHLGACRADERTGGTHLGACRADLGTCADNCARRTDERTIGQ
jgi:hypothetical protein